MTPPTMTDLAADELAAVKVFKALGDPARFRIVGMLTSHAELGCGDLASALDLSAPALSHHTRILQESGLIAVRREGSHHYFRLRKDQIKRLAPGLLLLHKGRTRHTTAISAAEEPARKRWAKGDLS